MFNKIRYVGGRLVCEFAYIRQGETESDEVNRFPFGQTHVGFAKLYPCNSSVYSDKKSSSPEAEKSSSPGAEKSSSPDILYIQGGIAATEKSSSPGDCIRVANGKLRGWQYYSLTALIPVDESPGIQEVYNHAARGCRKLLQTIKPGAYHYEPGKENEKKYGKLVTSTDNPMR